MGGSVPANSPLSAPDTLPCWARERREDDGKYRGWGAEPAPVDGLTPVTLWLQHVSGWQNRFRRSLWFIPCHLGPVAKSTAVLRRRVCNTLFIPSLAGKKANLFLSLHFTFFSLIILMIFWEKWFFSWSFVHIWRLYDLPSFLLHIPVTDHRHLITIIIDNGRSSMVQ